MPRSAPWVRAGDEPPVAELFADPIVHALMHADRILLADVQALIERLRSRVAADLVC